MPRHRRTRDLPRVPDVPFDQPAETREPYEPTNSAADAAQHLENLRVALCAADPTLFVRLVRPLGGRPYLHVRSPVGAGRLAEDIRVRRGTAAGGRGGYLLSWGEEITPVTTPEIAARRVLTVLGTPCRGR